MENLWEEEGIVQCVACLALSLRPPFLACSRDIVNCEGLELQEGANLIGSVVGADNLDEGHRKRIKLDHLPGPAGHGDREKGRCWLTPAYDTLAYQSSPTSREGSKQID